MENAGGGGFAAAKAATGPYAPVYKAYIDTIVARGSFEKLAQTSEQVAAVIADAIDKPTAALRIQTGPVARAFAAEKLNADPDGTLLQTKLRKGALGL